MSTRLTSAHITPEKRRDLGDLAAFEDAMRKLKSIYFEQIENDKDVVISFAVERSHWVNMANQSRH